MSDTPYDVIAFGAHPDDVETACGGLLVNLVGRGYRVAICDLTRGELGTNGSPEVRAREAAAAARVLGVAARLQSALPDGGLDGRDAEQQSALVELLRTHRPRLVIAPHARSRHPDHAEASELVRRAVFFAAVPRFAPGATPCPRPARLQAADYWPLRPSFVVDIGAALATKIEALRCYRSQFERESGAVPTHLNDPAFLRRVETDARHYGRLIGVAAGEAYVVDGGVPVEDPLATFAVRPEVPA
jgi:bacillithiol biosynthesis deacetylase BshB1